jgi:hypothetical protein
MKTSRLAFFLILTASFGVLASDWEFNYRPASVNYATYGNSLGDPTVPSKSDRKIAFEVKGQAAREMFEAIGPDRKDSCAQVSDVRFRSRDNEKLICTKSSQGVHTCYFGFDLKSGKSIGGSIC